MNAAPKETWLPVRGFEGRYQVSDLGNVCSCDRVVEVTGQVPRFRKGQVLKSSITKGHYRQVTLSGLTCAVHKLVLVAFRGPPKFGQESRHLNGHREDCRLENLLWGTHKENEADKALHGTRPHGKNHHNAKLSDDQIIEMRTLAAAAGKSPTGKMRRHTGPRLAAQFGVSLKYVQEIIAERQRPNPDPGL